MVSLFQNAKNHESGVTLYFGEEMDWAFYQYAEMYYDAANHVARHLLGLIEDEHDEKRSSRMEWETYPLAMIFLYRQSIELLLKAIFLREESCDTIRKECFDKYRHHLSDWLLLVKSYFQIDERDMRSLETLIKDINDEDPVSDFFRYAKDLNGETYRIVERKDIDIARVATLLHSIFNIIASVYRKETASEDDLQELRNIQLDEGAHAIFFERQLVTDDTSGISQLGYAYSKETNQPYCIAYEGVGRLLYDSSLQNSGKHFLPMCYAFRHLAELLQKTIIEEMKKNRFLTKTDKEKLDKIKNEKHGLLKPLNLMMKQLGMNWGFDIEGEELKQLKEKIKCLHDRDSHSSYFRYPVGRDLKPYFFKQDSKKSIRYTYEFLHSIVDDLDNILACLEAWNQD